MIRPTQLSKVFAMRHLSLLALLLPLLATPVHAAQKAANVEPQELVLHFQPQPGDKLRQSMDMKMQMSMNMLPGPNTTGEQRARMLEGAKQMAKGMSMDMKMVMRTEASEADAKGDYLLHIRGEGGQIHMNMPGGEAKKLPNPSADLEVDALIHPNSVAPEILRIKSGSLGLKDANALDGLAKGVMQQAFGAMSEMEGRRMKIGDSAEIPFNMQLPMQQLPADAKLNTTIAFKLKAIRKGIAYFDTTVMMSMEMKSKEQEAKKMSMNMKGSGTGVMEYRIADRLPLHQDMAVTMLMDMQMPGDVSMQMDMKMQMAAKAERYK